MALAKPLQLPPANQVKNIQKLMIDMGFSQVTNNQFSHPEFGYIHLCDFTVKEVAERIFANGKYKKCEEVYNVLQMSSLIR